jgi:hypothetical protein
MVHFSWEPTPPSSMEMAEASIESAMRKLKTVIESVGTPLPIGTGDGSNLKMETSGPLRRDCRG